MTAYRDGELYGESYVSGGLQAFEAGQTVITFGCRHLPSDAGKLLSARWERARLYDRALSAEEVAGSYRQQPHTPAMRELIAGLNESERMRLEDLQSEADSLAGQLAALGEAYPDPVDLQVWTEIAVALLNAKEFIFVK